MIPRILYTNAGLLIYSYQGWLDDKSPNFIDNPPLLASLQHGRTDRINVGPMKISTGNVKVPLTSLTLTQFMIAKCFGMFNCLLYANLCVQNFVCLKC